MRSVKWRVGEEQSVRTDGDLGVVLGELDGAGAAAEPVDSVNDEYLALFVFLRWVVVGGAKEPRKVRP